MMGTVEQNICGNSQNAMLLPDPIQLVLPYMMKQPATKIIFQYQRSKLKCDLKMVKYKISQDRKVY